MLVLEAKLRGKDEQYRALDEALRTARFVRNSCLRYWMDNRGLNKYDLNKYCAVLAKEFEASQITQLNSETGATQKERSQQLLSGGCLQKSLRAVINLSVF